MILIVIIVGLQSQLHRDLTLHCRKKSPMTAERGCRQKSPSMAVKELNTTKRGKNNKTKQQQKPWHMQKSSRQMSS